MTRPYFRPGAGTVIYNQSKEILIFRRADQPNIWQLQQGGMDDGEEPIATMWRELVEETGLTEESIAKVTEYPDWTVYGYTQKIIETGKPGCLGQAHRWYYLELKPKTVIDLAKAHDKEFIEWQWSTFEDLIAKTGDMKRGIYSKLNNYFEENIQS